MIPPNKLADSVIIILILASQHVLCKIHDPSISNGNVVTPLPSILSSSSQKLENETTYQCFHANQDLCLNPPDPLLSLNNSMCECFLHPTEEASLVCCDINDINTVLSCASGPLDRIANISFSKFKNVHIYNATLAQLDLAHSFWKELDNMIVTDGQIEELVGHFNRFTNIRCLNVSNNNLVKMPERALVNTKISRLDISHNDLSTMPRIRSSSTRVPVSIDIRGNNAMLCKSVLEALSNDKDETKYKFVAPETTFCLTNLNFSSWFNTIETVPIKQLENIKLLQTQCRNIIPDVNCTCESARMSFSSGLDEKNPYPADNPHLIFTVRVDCSNRNLTELPRNLPTNTQSLNVSNNKITSLKQFTENKDYEHILRLYADNNLISDITEFEGTEFIEQFQVLFLKNNKLKAIPIYVIANTLDRNPTGRTVHLAGNRLTCDCYSAKEIKKWLIARQEHIVDYDQIYCDNMPDVKIVDLNEAKLCQSQHDWTDYIYYLIAAEVFMLVALIMKVSYDYWIFKTAGYLPWPANKMPKLPCDWLCES